MTTYIHTIRRFIYLILPTNNLPPRDNFFRAPVHTCPYTSHALSLLRTRLSENPFLLFRASFSASRRASKGP